ncbi:MAG: hypothetical protein E6729_01250 [Finegoldia magna]|jgi:hypothetical protein|nr:hypothetical protein CO692_00140 [Enterococcus sp. FDAARGOS_375]MDU2024164.1 hypothetical protein [Finegoldia magna]
MKYFAKSFLISIIVLVFIVLIDLFFGEYTLQSLPTTNLVVKFIIFFVGYNLALKISQSEKITD